MPLDFTYTVIIIGQSILLIIGEFSLEIKASLLKQDALLSQLSTAPQRRQKLVFLTPDCRFTAL